jgi:cytochrome c biogenesis factor
MPDLGRAALVTAFLLLVYASVAGAFAAWHGRRRLAESAQNALIAAFGATAVAVVVLLTRSRATTSRSPTSRSTRAASCRSATR